LTRRFCFSAGFWTPNKHGTGGIQFASQLQISNSRYITHSGGFYLVKYMYILLFDRFSFYTLY
jgi:hypothetical protein